MMNSAVSRKRNRTSERSYETPSLTRTVWKAICFAMVITGVEGFTTVPNQNGRRATTASHPLQSVRPLQATSSFTATVSNRKSRPRRLSSEEQQELFRHVLEVRRIRNVEREVPSLDSEISPLDLARITGYGKRVGELEDAVHRGEESRERLITTNMGLVHYCVHDILKSRAKLRYITTDDLLQEGAIGLARAVDKYNPLLYDEKKAPPKFSTYAVYWIRAAILRCIAERDDVMRVPEHVSAAVRKITQAERSLGWRSWGEDEEEDTLSQRVSSSDDATSLVWSKSNTKSQQEMLAETTGLSDRMLQSAMIVRNRRRKHDSSVLSYESWMQLGQHYETDLQQPSNSAEPASSMEHIQQTLSRFLRPKEMEALSWRYGLNVAAKNPLAKRNYLADAETELFGEMTITKGKWGEAMSFTEVGRQMQVSAEYGRRLCHQALEKLRRAVAEGMLEPALLV